MKKGRTPYPIALALLLFCGIAPQEGRAQTLPATVTGKSYLVAFPRPLENQYDYRFPNTLVQENLYFLLYAEHPTTVLITPPDGGTFAVTLKGGEFREIELPAGTSSYVATDGRNSGKAYRVRAQRPVLLYCYMTGKFGAEAWTPLPIESWGKEYYAAVLPSESVKDVYTDSEFAFAAKAKGAPSQILITAAHDNTTVLIEPSDNVAEGGTEPIRVTLNSGETYLLRSMADSTDAERSDLGGTRITADKLVGVISGNTRSGALDNPELLTANSIKNLMVEALAPTEQHGTEFVFMPTWDTRHQRAGLDTLEDREFEYARIYGSSAGTTFGTVADGEGKPDRFTVPHGGFRNERFPAPLARIIRTDQPAQAMMNSSAAVKFNGITTTWGNYIGSSYLTWSPYMVELTPREQWPTRTAFSVPSHPIAMFHYVNVVSEAGNRTDIYYTVDGSAPQQFVFNRGPVPGSDLVWGTMGLAPGSTYTLQGPDGATFGGFVYGEWRGQEVFRPGATKKEDDKGHAAQKVMHASEYEENVALAYGYPLSPRRRVLDEPDALAITLETSPAEPKEGLIYRIFVDNATPVGIRSVDLSPESENAELEFLYVEDQMEVIGRNEAFVRIRPIDPNRDASARIVATDRAGGETAATYGYTSGISGVADESDAVADVRVIGPNPTAGSTAVMVTLRSAAPVRVEIVNVVGRRIATLADGTLQGGAHLLEWDASAAPAGVYFCRVVGGNGTAIRRIVLR